MSDECQMFQAFVQSRLRNSFLVGAKDVFNCLVQILQVFTFARVSSCLNVS